MKTTERCIRPDGWEISQKATKYTNITQERLVQEGTPLRDVLVEFLQDLGNVIGQSGKVVAHNLSYDGCTVHRELQREGLQVNIFEEAMKRGIRTTQPNVPKWCKKARPIAARNLSTI